MSVKAIIVDDEPLAITVMEGYLSRIPGIDIVATFNDGLPAFDFLQENTVDLVFLDVEMPKLTGIELVRCLQHPPVVIITSANRDYAIEGFELNVADYILKPVTFERLLKAYSKAMELIGKHSNDREHHDEFLLLKESKKNIRVKIDEILYIESLKDYVKVVTANRTVITKQSISSFEEQLDKTRFLRVHRSFIVALKHIQAFSSVSIEINDIEIPIGRLYKEEVIKVLESKNL